MGESEDTPQIFSHFDQCIRVWVTAVVSAGNPGPSSQLPLPPSPMLRPSPDGTWNRVHQVFYLPRLSETVWIIRSLGPLPSWMRPWGTWTPFHHCKVSELEVLALIPATSHLASNLSSAAWRLLLNHRHNPTKGHLTWHPPLLSCT